MNPLLAGRAERLIATLMDGFLFVIPLAALFMRNQMGTVIALVLVAILIAVQLYLLAVDGQTIGKRAMKMRIVLTKTGENGGWIPNILLRSVVNGILGIIPFYSLIDILLIFREDRRCVHDLIAGTEVIRVAP